MAAPVLSDFGQRGMRGVVGRVDTWYLCLAWNWTGVKVNDEDE